MTLVVGAVVVVVVVVVVVAGAVLVVCVRPKQLPGIFLGIGSNNRCG